MCEIYGKKLTLLEQTMIIESLLEKAESVFGYGTNEKVLGEEKFLKLQDIAEKVLDEEVIKKDISDEQFSNIFTDLHTGIIDLFIQNAEKEGYC